MSIPDIFEGQNNQTAETLPSRVEFEPDSLHEELEGLYRGAQIENLCNIPTSEIQLGHLLVTLLCETELPERFEVAELGTTSNNSVRKKFELLSRYIQFDLIDLPRGLSGFNGNFDDETLKVAPWVNVVHVGMKALNYMNSLSALQRGEIAYDPCIIATIAHALYETTTEANGDYFTRTSQSLIQKRQYAETAMRKAGSQFVNSSRRIGMLELVRILEILQQQYSK